MQIETLRYKDYLKQIPKTGRHILAYRPDENSIVVYQAFNNQISDFALTNQKFGGSNYNLKRMTWIKPNFLWMMYRSGWGTKENQERTLAIHLTITGFNRILENSVFSSFQQDIYRTRENWNNQLLEKDVRLQWDPDHDINGLKQERRAIQLGLKGNTLKEFHDNIIIEIEDITSFVKEQKIKIDAGQIDDVLIPNEKIYVPTASISKNIDIDGSDMGKN